MCTQHIKSPYANAETKISHIYTGPTDSTVYGDLVNCNQNGRLVAYTTKMYPNDDCTFFQVCSSLHIHNNLCTNNINMIYFKRFWRGSCQEHCMLVNKLEYSEKITLCKMKKIQELCQSEDFGFMKLDIR